MKNFALKKAKKISLSIFLKKLEGTFKGFSSRNPNVIFSVEKISLRLLTSVRVAFSNVNKIYVIYE